MATKKTLNTGIMLDAGIAALVVLLAPDLLNRFIFQSNPQTGTVATLIGGGAAYLLGDLLKKPNVSNIGIALALVEVIKPMVFQLTDQVTGGMPVTAPSMTQGQVKANAMNDFITLNGYIPSPIAGTLMTPGEYGNYYK